MYYGHLLSGWADEACLADRGWLLYLAKLAGLAGLGWAGWARLGSASWPRLAGWAAEILRPRQGEGNGLGFGPTINISTLMANSRRLEENGPGDMLTM